MTADQPTNPPQTVSEHDNQIRRILAEVAGQPYRMLGSLKEAQACKDGVVILDSMYVGQVYFVCPAALVKCSEAELQQLARMFGGEEGAFVSYQQLPVGAHVPDGCGGGEVTEGLWIHEDLRGGLEEKRIREVIEGRRPAPRPGGRVRQFFVHLYLWVFVVWQVVRLLVGFLWRGRHGDKETGGSQPG
jgi:hypothetical protein